MSVLPHRIRISQVCCGPSHDWTTPRYEPGTALTFEQILAQRKLPHEAPPPPPDDSQSELLLKLILEKRLEEQSEKVQDLLYRQQAQYAAAQQLKRTEELLSLYKRGGPLLNPVSYTRS